MSLYNNNCPDTADVLEMEQGSHLNKIIIREWEKTLLLEIIEQLESEHGKSLSLLFELEGQKLVLEELNRKLEETAVIYRRDIMMAEKVQKSLLFNEPPITSNFDIAFEYKPYASVSGDFYDFYIDKNTNDLIGITLADVSGHGISSGLLTALAKPVFWRNFSSHYKRKSLTGILHNINNELLSVTDGYSNYLTAILLRFTESKAEYINAAHPHIIIKKGSDSKILTFNDEPNSHGSILGLSIINEEYPVKTFNIETNDLIIIFSDCLNESTGKNKVQFGYEGIIDSLNKTNNQQTTKEIMDILLQDFNNHTKSYPLLDDLSIIIIKRK